VFWAMAGPGSTTNNLALGFSYVRQEEEGPKPFVINRSCESAAIRTNPSTKLDELIFGSNVGTVLRQDISARSETVFSTTGFILDSSALDTGKLGGLYGSKAYNMRVQTPQLLLGQNDARGAGRGDQPFTLSDFYIRSASVGNHNINVMLTRDSEPPESYVFNQGAAGFELDTSQLDIDTLGGVRMRLVYADPPVFGEARAVQLDITQGGLDEDAHLFEIGFNITPAGASRESV